MSIRKQERIVPDAQQLRAYIEAGEGTVDGSLLLADIWPVDPYENGGDINGAFTAGDTGIYFSSHEGEDPSVERAEVPETAESFATGALKVWSRKQIRA